MAGMKPEQKAARILELSKELNDERWMVNGNVVFELNSGDYIAEVSEHADCDEIGQWIAETRTLAPDIATALIYAHAEIERLKSAAKEYIDAVEAWGRIGVNRPKHVHNAAAKRRTAALDALKKLST